MIGCQTILCSTYENGLAGTGYTTLHATKAKTNTVVFKTYEIGITM